MIWKRVKGFENYEVSDTGSVRNRRTGAVVSQQRIGGGRKRVVLTSDGQQKNIAVDRLVADTFFPTSDTKRDIIHINGNLADSSVSNLAFEKQPGKRIRVVELDRCYNSRKECHMATGVSYGILSECLSGKRRHYKGLHFEEVD